jgi:glycosyltransferase involved in cell wall biosynthesis
LLYVGRIEHDKGIPDLLRFHQRLAASDGTAPELLLAGDTRLSRLDGPGTRYLGRISDEEKWDGYAGALAVVVPSAFESLSLLALEAFASGAPVIANGASEVLRGHAQRGGATLLFNNRQEYRQAVHTAMAERKTLAEHALRYARQYRWSQVMRVYERELEAILKANRASTSARITRA